MSGYGATTSGRRRTRCACTWGTCAASSRRSGLGRWCTRCAGSDTCCGSRDAARPHRGRRRAGRGARCDRCLGRRVSRRTRPGAQRVLPDGRAIGRPGAEAQLPVDERAREIAMEGSGSHLGDMTVDGVHLRVLTQALPRGGALQVARPLDEVDRQLDRVLLVLLFVGAGGGAIGAGLGALVARTALAPIDRFTRRTERLPADPDPSERMEVEGGEELERIARSFNATLDALERSVEAQRQLVADASHELRTPIASLRANIQTLGDAERLPPRELDALRTDIVHELDELTALVADVVELARGAGPAELADEVRLDEVVGAVVERARARVGERVDFRLRSEPTLVRGD